MQGPRKDRQVFDEPHLPEAFDTDAHIGSATDFTGLIPAAPPADDALANYEELYPFDATQRK